ncbi:MAG: methyltransferase domain-containing protein [Patescibacteria group bacterium]|jgi:ubiquinone/menaquinone biosynthesis C-methylase UbiE
MQIARLRRGIAIITSIFKASSNRHKKRMPTAETGSYDPHACHRSFSAELDRLRAQAAHGWKLELQKLTEFGLRDGMSILEVGSGPGYVTEQFLDSFPSARITALEIIPELSKLAQTRLQPVAGGRVDFVTRPLLDNGLPNDSFDVVIARFVLQHLPDPQAATSEIKRVLKPGGKLCIIDIDDAVLGLTTPILPELAVVMECARRLQAAQGGNRLIGRSLLRILGQSGYIDPRLDIVNLHSDDLGLETFLEQLHPDRFSRLVDAGGISDSLFSDYKVSHERLRQADDPIVMGFLFMACGTKSAA